MTGHIEIWHIWVVIGIVLFIVEIFVPAFLMGSLGIGAFAAALAAGFGATFSLQLAVFAVTMIIVFFLLRPFFNKTLARFDSPVKTGVHALIGREAIVSEGIDNLANHGRVKIGGEFWKALSADGRTIDPGAHVKVQRIEGVTVYVSPISEH